MDNVYSDNHIGCLDLHLSNITLNSYRGTLLEITLARFFLARAKVLSVLRLNTHLIRKDECMIIRAGRYCEMEEPPKMPNFVLEEHMAKQ